MQLRGPVRDLNMLHLSVGMHDLFLLSTVMVLGFQLGILRRKQFIIWRDSPHHLVGNALAVGQVQWTRRIHPPWTAALLHGTNRYWVDAVVLPDVQLRRLSILFSLLHDRAVNLL